jgi:predicted permease
MAALVLTIAYVFGLVALGFGAGTSRLLKPAVGDALTDFVNVVALPVLMFRTMISADFGAAAPWSLWSAYFLSAAIIWTLGQVVTSRVFRRERKAAIVGGLTATYSNLVLLGLPFTQSTIGHDAVSVLSLIIAVHLPLMLGVAAIQFALAEREAGQRVDLWREVVNFLRALAGNKLVIGILLGLAWRLTGLPLPSLVGRMVDTLAATAGPLALFSMGMGLLRFGISANFMPALTLALIKLFLMPALVLGAAILFGLPPLAAKVAVVGASMPVGVNPYLFAVKYGTGHALSSNALTLGTIIAVVSTGVWLAIATALFG